MPHREYKQPKTIVVGTFLHDNTRTHEQRFWWLRSFCRTTKVYGWQTCSSLVFCKFDVLFFNTRRRGYPSTLVLTNVQSDNYAESILQMKKRRRLAPSTAKTTATGDSSCSSEHTEISLNQLIPNWLITALVELRLQQSPRTRGGLRTVLCRVLTLGAIFWTKFGQLAWEENQQPAWRIRNILTGRAWIAPRLWQSYTAGRYVCCAGLLTYCSLYRWFLRCRTWCVQSRVSHDSRGPIISTRAKLILW